MCNSTFGYKRKGGANVCMISKNVIYSSGRQVQHNHACISTACEL